MKRKQWYRYVFENGVIIEQQGKMTKNSLQWEESRNGKCIKEEIVVR